MRKCNKCHRENLVDQDFYISSPVQCKRCYCKRVNEYQKKTHWSAKRYQRRKHEKRFLEQTKVREERRRLKFYGVSKNWLSNQTSIQQGRCEICKEFPKNGKSLCIDHNHTTREVRGLLCHQCNCLLGYSTEKESTLHSAIEYLKKYNRRVSKTLLLSEPVDVGKELSSPER